MQNKDSQIINPQSSRRSFIAATGMASAALLGSSMLGYKSSVASAAETAKFPSGNKNVRINDTDILNFALNLEYLEAEFYLRATTGSGLSDADISGVGTVGAVTGGSQVPFANAYVQQVAQEIAADELAHVRLLRQALGSAAVARPALDIKTAFDTAAIAAGIIPAGTTFDPYGNEQNFLIGAFVFEDVGVTAYHGAAPYIKSPDYLAAAAGILGTEAYHAGGIRTMILMQGQADPVLVVAADRIATARASLDGTNNDDVGVTDNSGNAILADTDSNAVTFARTFQQVLSIVYLGGQASNYGFFPNKLNGVIQ